MSLLILRLNVIKQTPQKALNVIHPFNLLKNFPVASLTCVCDKQMHSVGHANVIMLIIGLAFSVISKHIINHQITFIATFPSVDLHLH